MSFSDEVISTLMADNDIPDYQRNDFKAALERQQEIYDRHKAALDLLKEPLPDFVKDHTKRLKKITKKAQEIESLILENMEAYNSYNANGDFLFVSQLEACRLIIRENERSLEVRKDGGGRPKDIALNGAILNLKRIYQHFTGKEGKYTYDPYGETYTGKFVEFCQAFFTSVGESRTNASIAAAIKRARSPF